MAVELGRAHRKDIMMRLGLFIVPMTVYGAVMDDRAHQLNTICSNGHDPVRARQSMHCPQCAATDGFGRGKEIEGVLVKVDDDTLAKASTVDMQWHDEMELTIHPAEQVSQVLVPNGKTYWLSTNDRAGIAYRTLATLVEERTDLAFMTRWTIKSVAATYRLKVAGEGTLAIEQMADPGMVRTMPVVESQDIDPRQMMLIKQLADLLITDFEPSTGRGKSEVLSKFFAQHAAAIAAASSTGTAPSAAAGLGALQAALARAIAEAGPRPVPKSKRKNKGKKEAA